MNPLVGNQVLWLIPLEDILIDIEPASALCRTFHFTPKKLVESLVHEWFRFKLGQGPYQLDNIFRMSSNAAIEEIKGLFLLGEDAAIRPHDSRAAEELIDLTGHAVFSAVAQYVMSFGLPIEDITRMEIAGWCHKNLVVRFP